MRDIVKYSGIILLLLGAILLGITFYKGVTENNGLVLSAFLVIIGFVAYLITNKYYE